MLFYKCRIDFDFYKCRIEILTKNVFELGFLGFQHGAKYSISNEKKGLNLNQSNFPDLEPKPEVD
jgi:hypothetical protein